MNLPKVREIIPLPLLIERYFFYVAAKLLRHLYSLGNFPPLCLWNAFFLFFFVPLVAEEEQDQAYLYTSLLRFLPALH